MVRMQPKQFFKINLKHSSLGESERGANVPLLLQVFLTRYFFPVGPYIIFTKLIFFHVCARGVLGRICFSVACGHTVQLFGVAVAAHFFDC